jgi:hypothetical protein
MKTIKIFFISLVLVAFASCSEKIDLELNDTFPRLVVEGLLTDQPGTHYVRLSYSTSYYNSEVPPAVTDAIVTLSDGQSIWQLEQAAPGMYVTSDSFAGVIGGTYKLQIQIGEDEYEAVSALRPIAALDSVSIKPHDWIPNSPQVVVHFQDPPGSADFYLWKVFLNTTDLTNIPNRTPFSDDQGVDGVYISAPALMIQPQEHTLKAGDTIRVDMYSIDYDYMMFMIAMRRNTGSTGGPFAGPPANIKGNVSNGALGYFLTSAVSSTEMVYE